MDYNKILQDALNYARENMTASVSAAVILLFLLFKRPKIFFLLVLIALAAVGIMQLFHQLDTMMLKH